MSVTNTGFEKVTVILIVSPIVYAPFSLAELTSLTDGVLASISISLLKLRESCCPGVGSVRLASFPTIPLIVPLNAVVEI